MIQVEWFSGWNLKILKRLWSAIFRRSPARRDASAKLETEIGSDGNAIILISDATLIDAELIPNSPPIANDIPTERSAGDYAYAIASGGIGSIPVAGAALQTAFNILVGSPLERRRNAWLNSLNGRLIDLESKQILDIEALSGNEAFVTLLMRASDAAVRTHEEVKLLALRNAVVNSACSDQDPSDRELQFVRLVDELSGWHVRLLKYLRNPEVALPPGHPVLHEPQRDISAGCESVIPELRHQREVINQLYEDLTVRRLVVPNAFKVRPGCSAIAKHTTQLGDELLDYILEEKAHTS